MRKRQIFGGDYSADMWEAIDKARTKWDLRDALHLVCRRLQEFEARVEGRWFHQHCHLAAKGQDDHVASWEKEPFQTWTDIGRDCIIVFVPDARKISCSMNEEYAERMCRELNECWAFSRGNE